MKKVFKVLLIILVILVILAGGAMGGLYFYAKTKLSKMNVESISKDQIEVNAGVQEKLTGYRNIALFGIDSRQDDYGTGNRSDCIIIASINNDTKEVKLVSVYRDTYLQIPGRSLDKVTHAYSYGGAALAMSTLNTNLDLNISEYLTVNFNAVSKIVDSVGGIKMTITAEETKYINKYIDENNRVLGRSSSQITTAGTYNLDGVQALAYARIRYTNGGDYKRTERMRDVIIAVTNKLKQKNVTEINKIMDEILPEVSTNINGSEILKMLPTLMQYKITESQGWPNDVKGITLDRWYGVPVTLETSVQKLHATLFNESAYEVSTEVKSISNSIIKKTGYDK